MKLLSLLLGITLGSQPFCGRNFYPMSPNLIEHATGNYKSEWDAPATPADLPPVPDYEEIMIWDKKSPGRSGSDLEDDITNPEDGVVGDFENPGFWDFQGDGGFIGGDRTNGMGGDGEENINGRQIARIVGGAVANPFSHPWQVRVRACSGHACTRMCGGTLVSSRHVVTASHCIPPYGQTGIITLGAHEYFGPEARNVSVLEITQHPGWDKSTRVNDIAVITMAESVSFNKKIQPACLPDKSHCFSAGTRCVATGWGYIEEGGPRSNLLREVAVRIMESEHCNRADYYNGRIHEGYNQGERDACTGDSGGPLVCPLNNGGWVLTGVTSWGVGCARHKQRRPGVYADVRQYSDWISSIIEEGPDVVGGCDVVPSGFGATKGKHWTWERQPVPATNLAFDSAQMSTVGQTSSALNRPAAAPENLSAVENLWGSLATPRPPSKEAVKPTMKPRPSQKPRPQNKPSGVMINGGQKPAMNSPAKGVNNNLQPCDGLKGKYLKKCLKKMKKKAKGAKKNKKNKKKNYKALFDGMSKKEKKAAKRQQQEEEELAADRDAFVDYGSNDVQTDDDNALFAGWDY